MEQQGAPACVPAEVVVQAEQAARKERGSVESVLLVSAGGYAMRSIRTALEASEGYRCRLHDAQDLNQRVLVESKAALVLLELSAGGSGPVADTVRWLSEIEFPGAVLYCVPADGSLSGLDAELPAPHGVLSWPCPATVLRATLHFALARSAQDRQLRADYRRSCRALRRMRDLVDEALQGRPSLRTVAGALSKPRRAEPPAMLRDLSPREREVFDQAVRGGSLDSISQALFISPHTARNHLASIYRKLGVASRLELTTRFLPCIEPANDG